MRYLTVVIALILPLQGAEDDPVRKLWNELQRKRDKLASFHQEFEGTYVSKNRQASRATKQKIVIDGSQGRWRERSISGSGDRLRIFDGEDFLYLEANGAEYTRTRNRSEDNTALPYPYVLEDPVWKKAVEMDKRTCGLEEANRLCVLLKIPLKPGRRENPGDNEVYMLESTAFVLLEPETGLIVSARTVGWIGTARGDFQSDVSYALKRMTFGAPPDANLFHLPVGNMHEVKELSKWDAAKIRKELAGNAVPELAVSDLQGNPISLASFKGKTVLLDFWTTWCPPCRADAPALDKLYRKYGDKDLMIVGVSVSEDRDVVEKFLAGHPHSFPIVLTSENEMPRPYQIAAFPTYIVIDRDGTVASATEGDQGFGDLRRLLKKAGLETE